MMFGANGMYCVTYKTNEQVFEVLRRKYYHDFKIPISNENLEGCKGLELPQMKAFLCAKGSKVNFYDSLTFKQIDELQIAGLESETSREPKEIIACQTSTCENYLAFITGKTLIMDRKEIDKLIIYTKYYDELKKRNRYKFKSEVNLQSLPPELLEISMDFFFRQEYSAGELTFIVFASKTAIFELNFLTKEDASRTKKIFQYSSPFKEQPTMFQTNEKLSIFMVATATEARIFDKDLRKEHQIDQEKDYKMKMFKSCKYDADEKRFIIMSNRLDDKQGLYILSLPENNFQKAVFLLKWKTKLEISDCGLYFIEDKEKGFREVVASYKTIYVNTYNVIAIDITLTNSENLVIFRHESF